MNKRGKLLILEKSIYHRSMRGENNPTNPDVKKSSRIIKKRNRNLIIKNQKMDESKDTCKLLFLIL